MESRKPYNGSSRKLIIAIDLGTTFSRISYCILHPGIVPEIKGVTRFPAQEHVGSDAKIPTIIYYDKSEKPRAIGAEALQEHIVETAEDERWIKYVSFKLHLRPKSMLPPHMNENLPPLPAGKDLVAIFADFYAYLFKCTKDFILESHQSAASFWGTVENTIEFVLTHPNGWEGQQQAQMWKAVVRARLIPENDEGQARVHFVTEGEASLHFCINHGLSSQIKDDEAVVIVDAGGGTVDISSYSTVPSTLADCLAFEEVAVPQCHFTGSMFVTQRAREFVEKKLKGSKFSDEVNNIAECFDKTMKLHFRNSEEAAYVKFGSMRDKDPALDIRSGQLKLSGLVQSYIYSCMLPTALFYSTDVANFFEPSIASIIKVIDAQRFASSKTVSTVFLVGGFAASYWLFLKLQEHMTPLGISFSRPDSHVNKAVADGAVSMSTSFDGRKTEHKRRREKSFLATDGVLTLGEQYSIILPKDTRVSEETEFRQSYCRIQTNLVDPTWMDVEQDMYPVLCNITADTEAVAKSLKLQRRADGKTFFALEYDIILLFGRTKLKAQIAWEEGGVEKRGTARVVYNL
ncbi:hypothetical protein ARMSODRAFT_1022208 [Armillaria solidipes]|uniref:Actin-like ATPase domain-containing protein n=1 Tax=Armillaria solidipes TaxID=1076256 RepID=A0A2H3B3B5_9AGAR|nr:hypothetical protein ARMSODRAFT_1022208 [Armillaria solidipes]